MLSHSQGVFERIITRRHLRLVRVIVCCERASHVSVLGRCTEALKEIGNEWKCFNKIPHFRVAPLL